MNSVPLAKAKAHLSELVPRAGNGEATEITVRGQPVAQIVGSTTARKRIDLEELRRLTDSMPEQPMPGGEFVRWMRDTERY